MFKQMFTMQQLHPGLVLYQNLDCPLHKECLVTNSAWPLWGVTVTAYSVDCKQKLHQYITLMLLYISTVS